MKTSESAESALGNSQALEVREYDLARVSDDDPLDVAFAADEHADLAMDISRDLGELAGEVLGNQLPGRQTPLVQFFEAAPFLGFETRDVTLELTYEPKPQRD